MASLFGSDVDISFCVVSYACNNLIELQQITVYNSNDDNNNNNEPYKYNIFIWRSIYHVLATVLNCNILKLKTI